MERGLYDSVLSGERAQRHDSGGMFVVDDGERESERARRLEISAALPLFGKKARVSGGDAGVLEECVLLNSGWNMSSSAGFLGRGESAGYDLMMLLLRLPTGYVVAFTLLRGRTPPV